MAFGRVLSVKLNQCLYGYDGGHRLLAASLKLSDKVEATLLPYTDLVPGSMSTSDQAYWTGVPIREAKAYALMRTWSAPEMPRPGCVWTHVILIGFAEISRFFDLSVLQTVFHRPDRSIGFGGYSELVEIELKEHPLARVGAFMAEDCLRLLRASYGKHSPVVEAFDSDQIDNALFAVWSQQWPRLRRSFSFRTLGALSRSDRSKQRFDITIGWSLDLLPLEELSDVAPWESVAMEDLLTPGATGFRRFLWRYGSDIRRGRERFRFLADLYAATRQPTLSGAELKRTLNRVVAALPSASEGRVLKEDLLSGSEQSYSLMPSSDAIGVLEFIVEHPSGLQLSEFADAVVEASCTQWESRSKELISIADKALSKKVAFSGKLIATLASSIEPVTVLGRTWNHPIVREEMIRANPRILDSSDLVDLPHQDLVNVLQYLGEDGGLVSRVLDRLFVLDDASVAGLMVARFPSIAVNQVAIALAHSISGTAASLPQSWVEAAQMHARRVFELSRFLKDVHSTSEVAACAILLRFDVEAGRGAGVAAWANAAQRVNSDTEGETHQKLLAYLLALGLDAARPGAEPLFEFAFEPIHSALWLGRLSWSAQEIIGPFLPTLDWWQQWDLSRRLRVAVVNAYVENDLNPISFQRLTGERRHFERLTELAAGTEKGRDFLRQVLA